MEKQSESQIADELIKTKKEWAKIPADVKDVADVVYGELVGKGYGVSMILAYILGKESGKIFRVTFNVYGNAEKSLGLAGIVWLEWETDNRGCPSCTLNLATEKAALKLTFSHHGDLVTLFDHFLNFPPLSVGSRS